MDHRPATHERDPEPDLVRRAQRGDRAAFDQLARHYRASLLALAFFRTSNLEAAEDLVQEVLTRAWQKLPTLEEPASFAPWVRTIVANACRSWYRRSPAGTGSLDAESESQTMADRRQQPLEVVLAEERQRLLRRALAAIPEANRLALMMHVWGDYSYKESTRPGENSDSLVCYFRWSSPNCSGCWRWDPRRLNRAEEIVLGGEGIRWGVRGL